MLLNYLLMDLCMKGWVQIVIACKVCLLLPFTAAGWWLIFVEITKWHVLFSLTNSFDWCVLCVHFWNGRMELYVYVRYIFIWMTCKSIRYVYISGLHLIKYWCTHMQISWIEICISYFRGFRNEFGFEFGGINTRPPSFNVIIIGNVRRSILYTHWSNIYKIHRQRVNIKFSLRNMLELEE